MIFGINCFFSFLFLKSSKRSVIGYLESKDSNSYKTFEKVFDGQFEFPREELDHGQTCIKDNYVATVLKNFSQNIVNISSKRELL